MVDVVLPAVKGKNGAIVYDELTKLGLTNLTFASRDSEDTTSAPSVNALGKVTSPSESTTFNVENTASTRPRSASFT